MKLFSSSRSPFARKVLIGAHELGVQFDEVVSVAPIPSRPDVRLAQANPLAKVPTLVLADGDVLFDSHVICDWLDRRFAPGVLIPEDIRLRKASLRLEALADGTIEFMLALRAEMRRAPGDGEAIDVLKMRLGLALDGIEDAMTDVSTTADIGAISIACALSYADFRFPDVAWRVGRDGASEWFARFEARSSMAATRFKDA